MKNSRKIVFCLLFACIFSALFAVLIVSPANIDPSNTAWVINGGGDNLQHYLGWRFFRNSRWTRYLLFMQDLNYPIGSSVIITDSNPLFCLFFKLFRNILPETFQFNGIWLLTSFLLIGLFSAVITWQKTGNILMTVSGTVIAVLNPVVLQRAVIHDTLTAHWLILAAIWLAINDRKKWNLPGWFILTELTLLIHFYFIPMIAFVLFLQMIRSVKAHRPIRFTLLPPAVFSAALASGYFIFGYSHIHGQSGSYGELSMNLNAFINPDGISRFFSSRPIQPLQYEGFNYWGIGLLSALLLAMILGGGSFIKKIAPYFLPSVILTLAAVSNNAFFDLQQIYSFELPEKISGLMSVFRSSGRLVWPLYYLTLFASLSILSEQRRLKKAVQWIVLACAVLQLSDLGQFCKETADRFSNPSNPAAVLPGTLEDCFSEEIQHLYAAKGDGKILDAFALFAVDHGLSFNEASNARNMDHIFGGDLLDLSTLRCSSIQKDSVYVYPQGSLFPEELIQCDEIQILYENGLTIVIPADR